MLKALNAADWILIGILLFSTLFSIKRGLVREILSLLSWLAAFLVAFMFSEKLAVILARWISTPSVQISVSMVSLFALTLIVGAMINNVMADLLKKTGLTSTDRLFGMVFGFSRGLIIVMVLIIVCKNSFYLDDWWKQSKLIPHFLSLENGFLQAWDGVKHFFNQLLEKF